MGAVLAEPDPLTRVGFRQAAACGMFELVRETLSEPPLAR